MTSPPRSQPGSASAEWPSREVVAREIRRAMLDNPTDDSFNKRAEKREAIANEAADVILARFELARAPTQCGVQTDEANELVGFLAVHANQYALDHGLDGLHPTHYDLMVKHGARMVSFKRATNAPQFGGDAYSLSSAMRASEVGK